MSSILNLEEAREQLLSQIELQLCRIYDVGSEVPKKLQEFYDYVEALPINHLVFEWYLKNHENAAIEYKDGAVQVSRITDDACDQINEGDEIDELIWKAIDNRN